jgi:capsular polysaccharide biosynthesis protein
VSGQVDDWYESETPVRTGLKRELMRIATRTRSRPLPVLIVALLLFGAVAYKVISKKPIVEADVTLMLTDRSLARDEMSIPVAELKQYVEGVLMPDSKLMEMIERRDMYKLRKKLGDQFALDSLREQIEITVWKNTYTVYDEDAPNAARSARVGITVGDVDPDVAFGIARDLTTIVMQTFDEQHRDTAKQLSASLASYRSGLERRVNELNADRIQKERDLDDARRTGKPDVVAVLELLLGENLADTARARRQLDTAIASKDNMAEQVAEAGLDTTLSVVDEHKPEAAGTRPFVLALVLTIIGVCTLFAAALIVGAFDSRIHDADDVSRLNLPLLGHLPRFPGDDVGALRSRGVPRRRVPWWRRWR